MSPSTVVAGRFEAVPLRHVRHEGAYLSLTTGRLFQIPAGGLPRPALEDGVSRPSSSGRDLVVRLAEDPFTPLWKLNLLARTIEGAGPRAV